MADLRQAPRLNDDIRTYGDGTGNTVALSLGSDGGKKIEFQMDVGLLPKLIGKLFDAANDAAAHGNPDPKFEAFDKIQGITAQVLKNYSIGNVVGENRIGLRIAISGIPFTLALTPEQAVEMADRLKSVAANQAQFVKQKPH